MEKRNSKHNAVTYILTATYVRVKGYGDEERISYASIPETIKGWNEPMKSEMLEFYKERYPLTECEVCGKMFRRMRPTFTCSPECSHKRHNAIQLERSRVKVECDCTICGKTFTKRRNQQKYVCSAECGKEYQRLHKGQVDQTGKKKRANNIVAIEKQARKKGLHYADIQKQETLAMVGRVEI